MDDDTEHVAASRPDAWNPKEGLMVAAFSLFWLTRLYTHGFWEGLLYFCNLGAGGLVLFWDVYKMIAGTFRDGHGVPLGDKSDDAFMLHGFTINQRALDELDWMLISEKGAYEIDEYYNLTERIPPKNLYPLPCAASAFALIFAKPLCLITMTCYVFRHKIVRKYLMDEVAFSGSFAIRDMCGALVVIPSEEWLDINELKRRYPDRFDLLKREQVEGRRTSKGIKVGTGFSVAEQGNEIRMDCTFASGFKEGPVTIKTAKELSADGIAFQINGKLYELGQFERGKCEINMKQTSAAQKTLKNFTEFRTPSGQFSLYFPKYSYTDAKGVTVYRLTAELCSGEVIALEHSVEFSGSQNTSDAKHHIFLFLRKYFLGLDFYNTLSAELKSRSNARAQREFLESIKKQIKEAIFNDPSLDKDFCKYQMEIVERCERDIN